MTYRVYRDIDRPPAAVLEELKGFGLRTVLYASPLTLGADVALDPGIKPLRRDLPLFGPAFTVQLSAADHLMTMYATSLAKPGDVLVIDGGGRTDVSIWGGSMLRSAVNRQLAGAVVDGAVSDSAALSAAELPVFARGATPAWGSWDKPGSINVPVRCGGRVVEPGDLIVGDADGVVAVPQSRLGEACERIRALAGRFPAWRTGFDEGKVFLEVLGLQGQIAALHIPELERSPGR